jgi:hypothetical protein
MSIGTFGKAVSNRAGYRQTRLGGERLCGKAPKAMPNQSANEPQIRRFLRSTQKELLLV